MTEICKWWLTAGLNVLKTNIGEKKRNAWGIFSGMQFYKNTSLCSISQPHYIGVQCREVKRKMFFETYYCEWDEAVKLIMSYFGENNYVSPPEIWTDGVRYIFALIDECRHERFSSNKAGPKAANSRTENIWAIMIIYFEIFDSEPFHCPVNNRLPESVFIFLYFPKTKAK